MPVMVLETQEERWVRHGIWGKTGLFVVRDGFCQHRQALERALHAHPVSPDVMGW